MNKKFFYGIIRAFLPSFLKGMITKIFYIIGIKPTINKKSSSPFQKGIIVFSADFEMAWAFRYSKTKHSIAEQMGIQERNNIPILLKLFDEHSIPVTWATVGHLFLDSCKRENGVAHQDMVHPRHFDNRNWNFTYGDWYDADPCSDLHQSPAWYAPDLISMIRNSEVKHEIGCHTFSHIDCTDKNCPKELLESELKKCVQIAEANALKLNSLVFPGGTLGNYSLIKSLGFMCYRKPMEYDVDVPIIDNYGLVAIPSSYGMDKPIYKCSDKFCFYIAKKYIDLAIKHKKVAHLWFHPSMNPWYLKNVFPKIIGYVAEKRNNGLLEVLTMNGLTKQMKNETPSKD